ncbi:putative ankyrin repeat protein RF_0381 [Saccostrea echinata]|uniref:putative ankyrin repeat protein RF_0381 n=1 Tax=Saccostrea echinata TaxID=191078 RepID=UPI002A806AD8|nr:putative ankyrin repeat protein RF_0381 [Saccostrea echinata]
MASDRRFDFCDETYLGHNILHLACKRGRFEICTFLLSQKGLSDKLLNAETKQMWNATHFAAISGDVNILQYLIDKGIKIKQTKNDLRIVDIACVMKNDKMCEKLIQEDSFMHNEKDRNDWNIAHYAARVGNIYVFELLKENEDIVLSKTRSQKSVLHICCEYGQYDVCNLITQNYKKIIFDVDKNGWNSLHFASKGGNLNVLKLIDKTLVPESSPQSLCMETHDGKTALHISCIHKHLDICEYLCSRFTIDEINVTTNDRGMQGFGYGGWNAAHYVAVEIKQDGSEEKLFDLLFEKGIDFKAVTAEKYSVLAVACEHKNKRLITHLLTNYRELLDVETSSLKTAAKNSCDDEVIQTINKALEKKAYI